MPALPAKYARFVPRSPEEVRTLLRKVRGRGRLVVDTGLGRNVDNIRAEPHMSRHQLARLEEYGLLQALSDDPSVYARWLTWRPPGHFYSPVPNLEQIERIADSLWPPDLGRTVSGINLNEQEQLRRFARIAAFARELDVPQHAMPGRRYYSDNYAYGIGDGLTLHGMLRDIAPARMIEIGSGFSSAMTLDTVEKYLPQRPQLTFIEPYPELLESILQPGDCDQIKILDTDLQDVPLETFEQLQDGDILFIDSTHVLRTGSDVAYLYGEVVPRLNKGVYVHIHDIFRGFEYPREWVMEGRAWSEQYIVRAFLAYNDDFEILLFNDWMVTYHRDVFAAELPEALANPGGALWLHRVKRSR